MAVSFGKPARWWFKMMCWMFAEFLQCNVENQDTVMMGHGRLGAFQSWIRATKSRIQHISDLQPVSSERTHYTSHHREKAGGFCSSEVPTSVILASNGHQWCWNCHRLASSDPYIQKNYSEWSNPIAVSSPWCGWRLCHHHGPFCARPFPPKCSGILHPELACSPEMSILLRQPTWKFLMPIEKKRYRPSRKSWRNDARNR